MPSTRQIQYMKPLQVLADKTAICLSLLCTIHCLAFPITAILLPAAIAISLADEAWHLWMIIVMLPISVFALIMGCRKHKQYRLLPLGGAGLLILLFAVFAGHDLLGEFGEKVLTLIGSAIVVLGHVWNYRLCKRHERCDCTAS